MPHWWIGIFIPSLLGPLDFMGVLIPYLTVGRLYTSSVEEANNGLLINVINEADVFVDDKKILRASMVKEKSTEFTFYGKDYRR